MSRLTTYFMFLSNRRHPFANGQGGGFQCFHHAQLLVDEPLMESFFAHCLGYRFPCSVNVFRDYHFEHHFYHIFNGIGSMRSSQPSQPAKPASQASQAKIEEQSHEEILP